MKSRIVSVVGGARWLAEGWRLFRVAPANWFALVFVYWMGMTALSVVPWVGVLAAMLLIPGLSVGFMAASRSCERGKAPALGLLFDAFRTGPAAQLVLGVAYVLSLAFVLWATGLADGGALARWMLYGTRPPEEMLHSDEFLAAMAIAAGLYVPVLMLFWFGPVLASWHAMAAGQALFYSFFACLLNWRAFLGYGVAAALLSLGIPFLVLSALLLAGDGQLRGAAVVLVFPLLVILLPILFASFYASYVSVFGTQDEA
jgi:hypothetical protein